jgi:hypothetical protein
MPSRAQAETWEVIWAAEKSWCQFKNEIGTHSRAAATALPAGAPPHASRCGESAAEARSTLESSYGSKVVSGDLSDDNGSRFQ